MIDNSKNKENQPIENIENIENVTGGMPGHTCGMVACDE
jgi:hypothetical protein